MAKNRTRDEKVTDYHGAARPASVQKGPKTTTIQLTMQEAQQLQVSLLSGILSLNRLKRNTVEGRTQGLILKLIDESGGGFNLSVHEQRVRGPKPEDTGGDDMLVTIGGAVLTLMEFDVLRLVAKGKDVGVRTQVVVDGWGHGRRQLPGVVSSLVKKGIVWTTPKSAGGRTRANSAFIGLTKLGRKVWETPR